MVKRTIAQHMSCLAYSALYWHIGTLAHWCTYFLYHYKDLAIFVAYDPLVKKNNPTKPQKPQTCSADGMFNSICRSRLSS